LTFEPRHADVLARFVAAFPIPKPYSQGGTDEDRRFWTRRCAEQFHFSFPGEGWGHKSAHAARVPTSTDSIARQVGSELYSYDLIRAGGDDTQAINLRPSPDHITGQYFIEVDAKDHLAGFGGGPVEAPPMLLGATAFWWLGGMRRLGAVGRQTLDEQIAEVKAMGADFVRVIFNLRSPGDDESNPWLHIGLSYQDAEFESDIRGLCDLLRANGLKLMAVLEGGTRDGGSSRHHLDRLVDRSANALRDYQDVLYCVEMWNEVVNTGGSIDDCKHMAERFHNHLPGVMLALSSPPASHMGGDLKSQVAAMQLHIVQAMNIHWPRGGAEADRPPDLGPLAPDVLISGEPKGIESSVQSTNNPDDFSGMWNAAKAAGYAAFVFHPDAWIWSTYITDRYKGNSNGRWRLCRDHDRGQECMDRMRALRGATGGVGGSPHWGMFIGGSVLRAGQRLLPGQRMVADGGSHYFEYQADGNMVVRRADGHPIWSSKASHAPGYVAMQTDGHFVEYDASNTPRRATHTWGQGGVSMTMQPDGHLVMRRADGTPIWGSFNDDIYGEDGDPVR
jgi:hypothetical protein